MRRILFATVPLILLLPAFAPAATPGPEECNWRMYGHDITHRFSTTCSDISPLNVATTHVKWAMPTPAPVTATPSVVDGVLYVGSADGTFYAMATDPPPGPVEPLWTFEVDDDNLHNYGKIVSSAAVEDIAGTRVVIFSGGSTLYVLRASNGELLAKKCMDPRPIGVLRCKGSPGETIESEVSPAVVRMPDGTVTVLTGIDFDESTNAGRAGLIALRLHTSPWSLETLWKLDPETQTSYTTDITKDGVPGYAYTTDPLTYGGVGKGCGNVWSSPTVDTNRMITYFAVANCGRVLRPGDVGGEGTIAADVWTGKMLWRHIPRPNNTEFDPDFDFGASPQMLPGNRVGTGGKDGIYYAYPRLDPNGDGVMAASELDFAAKVANGSDIGGIIGSTALGEVRNDTDQVIDAVFMNSAVPFSTRDFEGSMREIFADPRQATSLHAIDANTGRVLWHAPNIFPSYASVTYANGLVYMADTFGFSVWIYDANTGLPLWVHPVNGAPSSAPTIVGDSFYMGVGTAADPVREAGNASGIWAFEAVVP